MNKIIFALSVLFFSFNLFAISNSPDKAAAASQLQLKTSSSFCTAVALSPTCFLTASHCLGGSLQVWRQPQTYNDSAGNPIPYPGATVGNVNASDYVYGGMADGVVIAQVDRPLNGVSGAQVTTLVIAAGSSVLLNGNGGDENGRLHVSNANFVNTSACGDQTCAYPMAGNNGQFMRAIGGDSGGGVFFGGKIQGIVSYSANSEIPQFSYIELGPLGQKIAQKQASVCTGSPPQNALSCSITSPSTVLVGSPINYTLTSSGPAISAKVMNVSIVPFNGSHQGSVPTSGTGPVILQAAVYSQAGSSASCASNTVVRVVSTPSCTLTASSSQNVTSGSAVTLSLDARGYVTSAKINGATAALTGNMGGQKASLTVNPTQSTTYTANVYGPNGLTASCQASVTVAAQTSCDISFSPSTVEQNGVSTMTFSVTGPYTNPTLNGNPLSGTLPHTEPARTGTVGTWGYNGSVKNQAGQVIACSANYTVTPPSGGNAPSCTIEINPSTVIQNGAAQVKMTATGQFTDPKFNANSVSLPFTVAALTANVGVFSFNGSVKAANGQIYNCSKNFTVTAPGGGGGGGGAPPSCTLSVSPNTVSLNQVATLSFTATGQYSNATLEQKPVSLPYSVKVPTNMPGTFLYTGQVMGPNGSFYSCTATYTVGNGQYCNKVVNLSYTPAGLYTDIPLGCVARSFTFTAPTSCAPHFDMGANLIHAYQPIQYGPVQVGTYTTQVLTVGANQVSTSLSVGFQAGGIACPIKVTVQ